MLDWLFGFKRKRRNRIRQQPFPAEWTAILEKNVPYYAKLTNAEAAELQGHIKVFLAEKEFEGRDGLEITDEIRVTIAAQACILLLNRETDYYPSLNTIHVYPTSYSAPTKHVSAGGVISEGMSGRLGESWQDGPVMLSWNDVLHGADDVRDGHNVVLHEFAHQLDSQTGSTEGAPVLPERSMYTTWARVLGSEYEKLLENIEENHRTIIDAYGGTNPAEFFAVITETFFERPEKMKEKHPELYDQLKLFYKQDPAERY